MNAELFQVNSEILFGVFSCSGDEDLEGFIVSDEEGCDYINQQMEQIDSKNCFREF